MARTSLTAQKITRTGLTPALADPTIDGDVVDVGAVALFVDNTTAGSVNVTVQTPLTIDDLDVAELVVAVPAGATKLIGPFPSRTFAQPSGVDAGRMYVNYSVQVGVKRAVIAF